MFTCTLCYLSIMNQRWTYRCYPTPEQQAVLARTFGCTRYVYNWALAARTNAFREGGRMTYAESDKSMTQLKKQDGTAWLNDVSCIPLQQSLRDLQSAFSAFFSKRSGYPSFKKKGDRDSARYTKSGFSLTDGNRLRIAKLGVLRVRWNDKPPREPSSVTIIREPTGRYYVSFVVNVPAHRLATTGQAVGVDFGLTRLATLSTGERIANPRHGRKQAARLAMLQKRLARKQKGSRRRILAKRAVARCHAKIAFARKDTLHKLTTRLIREFDVIYVEDLNLRGMVKNHSLARSLSDASIGTAIRMLECKAEWYGKQVVKIDRWFPSTKMCSCCGHVVPALPLSVRDWECPKCGKPHDRDWNAAKNILAVGQTVSAHGDGVRASSLSGEEATCH